MLPPRCPPSKGHYSSLPVADLFLWLSWRSTSVVLTRSVRCRCSPANASEQQRPGLEREVGLDADAGLGGGRRTTILGGETDTSEVHGAAADAVAGINGARHGFQTAGRHGDCVAGYARGQLSPVDGGINIEIADGELGVAGCHGVAVIHGNGAVVRGIGGRGGGIVAVVGAVIQVDISVEVDLGLGDRIRDGFGEGVGLGDSVVAVVGAGIYVDISIEVEIGLGDGIGAGLGDGVIAVVGAGIDIDIGIDVGSVGRVGIVTVIGAGIQRCIQVQGVADQIAVFHAGAAIVGEVDIVK